MLLHSSVGQLVENLLLNVRLRIVLVPVVRKLCCCAFLGGSYAEHVSSAALNLCTEYRDLARKFFGRLHDQVLVLSTVLHQLFGSLISGDTVQTIAALVPPSIILTIYLAPLWIAEVVPRAHVFSNGTQEDDPLALTEVVENVAMVFLCWRVWKRIVAGVLNHVTRVGV